MVWEATSQYLNITDSAVHFNLQVKYCFPNEVVRRRHENSPGLHLSLIPSTHHIEASPKIPSRGKFLETKSSNRHVHFSTMSHAQYLHFQDLLISRKETKPKCIHRLTPVLNTAIERRISSICLLGSLIESALHSTTNPPYLSFHSQCSNFVHTPYPLMHRYLASQLSDDHWRHF